MILLACHGENHHYAALTPGSMIYHCALVLLLGLWTGPSNQKQASAFTLSTGVNGTYISVVSGSTASLPCDIKPPSPRDKPSLILWFKEEEGKPIFSVEVTGSADISKARPWSSRSHFGDRAEFLGKDRHTAILTVRDIRAHESGLYRCRVDFQDAQTSNSFVHINVIVLPNPVTITDGEGRERNSYVGPYREDDSISLTCKAVGGSPSPGVRWLRNGTLLDSKYTRSQNKTVINTITISHLTRVDLHSEFTCLVSNNNITNPISHTVILDMNFPPTSVAIEDRAVDLVVGSRTDIICRSSGSRPPAHITWYIDSARLEGSHESSSVDGNITESLLEFLPTMRHLGKVLRCRASNPLVTKVDIFADLALNISYAPNVELVLGKSISAESIYEGGDAYFDCRVQASPPPDRVNWYHNGFPLEAQTGVLFTNYSLVLQKIGQARGGAYMCESSNPVGKGRSKEISLDIKYVPVCANPEPEIYGVSKAERVDILCRVHANPSEVEFRWTFNNSAELIRVPNGRAVSEGSRSTLSYTPQTSMDYGTLLCLASNTVGEQHKPCVFHIILAVSPEPVENCSVINKSSETFHLQCLPGFDGGMNQTFHIMVKERNTHQVMYDNASLNKPEVLIQELDAGQAYIATVTALNKKGASLSVYKMVETLQQPELQLVEEKIDEDEGLVQSDLVLGVGSGVGLCLTILLFVGIWVRRARCGRRTEASLLQEYTVGQATAGDESCRRMDGHRKSILKKHQGSDSSPDLIPHVDQESWNFCAASPCNELMKTEDLEESCEFPHKESMSASLLSIKSSSREGLLQHSSDCDMEDPINVFPNKISTSTLKRGTSTQRTFLLKEKRESIV